MNPILPMEPKKGDAIPLDTGWIAQIKWDGVRILTYYDGRNVRLFNRKAHERTLHYPELMDIRSYCMADSVILDGEMIALGSDGKPSFHEVMRRDGIRRTDRLAMARRTVPVAYMIFDVIYCNGQWVDKQPLEERIEMLSNIIVPNESIQLVTPHHDADTLFQVMKQEGMEGIVVKRKDSPYLIGEKKDTWLKIKNFRDVIAVIGGYTMKNDVINSILVGLYDQQGNLWYIGHSGTGTLTMLEWRELTEWLRPKTTHHRPFTNQPERHSGAHWVLPEVTVKIKYMEWTEGRSLRQPTIEGFIPVDPLECRFDEDDIRKT